jgi:hypothetical protein
MNKPALLLSLLALAALGLVAFGGDDDQTIAASETETTRDVLAANNTDYKPCGYFGRYKFAVEGFVSTGRGACCAPSATPGRSRVPGVASDRTPGGGAITKPGQGARPG